jgi:glutathione S-transferase
MSQELVFYTHPMSRGRIVRWMLEEIGQPYRTELLEYAASMKAPAYLAINPMGKVPALRHGDTVITEAAAICAYLADAFPAAGMAPPSGSPLRGPYYRWLFFTAGPVEYAATNQAMGLQVPSEKEGMMGYGNLVRTLDTIEAALQGQQALVGGRFSAADIYLGSHLAWGMQFGTIAPRAVFQSYVAGLKERPAALRAAAIDDALVKKPAG